MGGKCDHKGIGATSVTRRKDARDEVDGEPGEANARARAINRVDGEPGRNAKRAQERASGASGGLHGSGRMQLR